jgi:hypothetical protein
MLGQPGGFFWAFWGTDLASIHPVRNFNDILVRFFCKKNKKVKLFLMARSKFFLFLLCERFERLGSS